MTRARIAALQREALHLILHGLCHEHIDREIAQLEADNDRLPTPADDEAEGALA